ncbi:MAG: carbohydrate ABC transporter permease [Clostridia bacterium]
MKTVERITLSILRYLPLIILCVITITPFYMMLVMSSHSASSIGTQLNLWFGGDFLKNATTVFSSGFLRFYWNSFYIAVIASVGGCLLASMAGYGIAKYRFRFKKAIMNFTIMVMMIPWAVSIIGYIMEMRGLGLTDSHIPVILPALISPYGVFLMTQFFGSSVPNEIIESARLDGCGEFHIFLQIAIPFTRSALITLFLLIFLFSWNNFFFPLIFISKTSMFTIPLGVFSLSNQYQADYGAQMFALSLATIPLLIVFIINSKNLIKGLSAGAVKG